MGFWLAMIVVLATPTLLMANEEGAASYYADSLQGNSTASGEPYDRDALTAAHRTLAFGTKVRVTNLDNGRSVVVRINDRGPHVKSRIIDLSGAAAEKLGMLDAGEATVRIEIVN
jgi:rare lipoprotein A